MLHRLPFIMFAGFTLFTLSVEAQEKKDDKKAIQGSWAVKKDGKSAKLTFDVDKFTFEIGGGSIRGTFTIDSSKTPKHMDWTVTEGSDDKAKRFVGKTMKSIYEVDGDRLKWQSQKSDESDRPTAFAQDGDSSQGLFLTLDREKKK